MSYLLDNRLRPAGILAGDPGVDDAVVLPTTRPDPLLSLKFRVGVVPERASWVIAGIFQPMFFPPVILAVLSGFVLLDVLLYLQGGFDQLGSGALALIQRPELTLLVLGALVTSLMFHECGHVAACRYGGARPGNMGVGLYLVWPAMYSTVTDSYRLNRRGRLRTDLGGVYFNVVAIVAMSLVHLVSGSPWLLVAILLMHVETIRQFFPFVRLDGYYVLSDIIGVPDLFSRMGPVLRSMFRRGRPHPRVQELKPWVRRVVTLWVVLVIPAIVYFLLPLIILAPKVLPVVWEALSHRGSAAADAAMSGHIAAAALGLIQMILLVLPWAGAALIFWLMGRQLIRAVCAYLLRRRAARPRRGGRHRAVVPPRRQRRQQRQQQRQRRAVTSGPR